MTFRSNLLRSMRASTVSRKPMSRFRSLTSLIWSLTSLISALLSRMRPASHTTDDAKMHIHVTTQAGFRVASDAFDDNCRGHAAGRAHGDERITATSTLKLVERGADQDGSRCRDRVSKRDRPAIRVHLRTVEI